MLLNVHRGQLQMFSGRCPWLLKVSECIDLFVSLTENTGRTQTCHPASHPRLSLMASYSTLAKTIL